ncbi:putative serine/threonine protein kinase IREH1 [Vitis vinifera]|uniref:non-specific serine/threonine protein kinase n=1 Tax=Vitis vinifera TaxID=29760 RepID=A0A438KA05_VITVI|nr:putative serine/threonine protein kinase IREH1 [Vitis vinifera]
MIRKNAVESILAERDILISVRNPFVVRFFYSFTCRENLYLVMEYLNGGDLYSLLRSLGCLDEDVARIYIAEVVLALEYLHSLRVVHRDLKPDNLLIAHDGHIKRLPMLFGLGSQRVVLDIKDEFSLLGVKLVFRQPFTPCSHISTTHVSLVVTIKNNVGKAFVKGTHYSYPCKLLTNSSDATLPSSSFPLHPLSTLNFTRCEGSRDARMLNYNCDFIREVFGRLEVNKNTALQQLEYWDGVESERSLSIAETEQKKEAKDAFHKWVLMEEHMANAHRRNNSLDRITINGELLTEDQEGDKAPGLDGFTVAFWQDCWDFVKEEVVDLFKEFFEHGSFAKSLNTTFLVLIPKKGGAEDLGDFRPISLLEGLYKLLAKVLANRLKKVLDRVVSVDQNAFVLRKMGFGSRWMDWMWWCISTTKFSILINGVPAGFFSNSKGFRQGDPLSPYLFVLGMEVLSTIIRRAGEGGFISGCRMRGRGGEELTVSHLLFADDTLIFCKARREQLTNLSWILAWFEAASGLKINLAKSVLIPDNLWKTAIGVKYGQEGCGWRTKEVCGPYGVGLWKEIMKEADWCWENMDFKVGKGNRVLFWTDKWCGNEALSQTFPQLFTLAGHKNAKVYEVWDSSLGQGGWNLSLARDFNDWEMDQIGEMLNLLKDVRISLKRTQ